MNRGPEQSGAGLIAAKTATLPASPGVYRMIGRTGRSLYVGKARDLKKRVAAYRHPERHPLRIARMIALTRDMEFTLTDSESEALLLEAAMIKRFRPAFNILLRDDKSFPLIAILDDHEAPRLAKHRGRGGSGEFFGPFVSADAVDRTLTALQKAFLLRSCPDSVYAHRTRPCLLYQIKRCAAPCTGEISLPGYAALVDQARAFLRGDRAVQRRLAEQMEGASRALDFERAALYRDRLQALERVQSQTRGGAKGLADADIAALHREGGHSCVQLFVFRGGQNLGNRSYFPRHGREEESGAILGSFLAQFYESRRPPPLILVGSPLADGGLLARALSLRAGRRVRIERPARGGKRALVGQAESNAQAAFRRRQMERMQEGAFLAGLGRLLDLPKPPRRIEIYDNSHIQGSKPVGAMVVSGPGGFMKNQYRLFNLQDASCAPGDDLAMLREVLRRRFGRLARGAEGALAAPDLVIMDGGATQLAAARESLARAGFGAIRVIGIAKTGGRHAGRETLFLAEGRKLVLDPGDPILYYLQRLRDEAHRFAIGHHRGRRRRGLRDHSLDSVPGIGGRRKRALLSRFGSARAVSRATIAELARIEGIGEKLARSIYEHFHGESFPASAAVPPPGPAARG